MCVSVFVKKNYIKIVCGFSIVSFQTSKIGTFTHVPYSFTNVMLIHNLTNDNASVILGLVYIKQNMVGPM